MHPDSRKRLPLLIVVITFILLWGFLCLLMLMTWAFQDMEDTQYGVLTFGALFYGLFTLGYSVNTFRNPGRKRERILWALCLPVPLVLFTVLEWAY